MIFDDDRNMITNMSNCWEGIIRFKTTDDNV